MSEASTRCRTCVTCQIACRHDRQATWSVWKYSCCNQYSLKHFQGKPSAAQLWHLTCFLLLRGRDSCAAGIAVTGDRKDIQNIKEYLKPPPQKP
jgi:hypothetical protein